MTTSHHPPKTERPGNNVSVLEMQTNAPASDNKLMAVLHGHRHPRLRSFSFTGPPTAQTVSWVVHLNNTLPGTQTSFVYWQDLAVSHFVFAHLHKHQMVPVSCVCVCMCVFMCVHTGALANSLFHRCRWKSKAVWDSLKHGGCLDAVFQQKAMNLTQMLTSCKFISPYLNLVDY